MQFDPSHPLSESELNRLTSDELIDYIRSASEDGRPELARPAIAVLAYRHFDDVKRRVSLRIPPDDIEDVAMAAIVSALKAAFDGRSIGEFRSWLNTIVDRRVADYYRKRESSPQTTALPTEHQGEEDIWGEEPSSQDEAGAVVVQSLIDERMAELSPAHARVIELYVFEDREAPEVAEIVNREFDDLQTPMSAENVHQIKRRFAKAMREHLDEGG